MILFFNLMTILMNKQDWQVRVFYHSIQDFHIYQKSLGYLTSIYPSWFSSDNSQASSLYSDFRIYTEAVVSFGLKNIGFSQSEEPRFIQRVSAPVTSPERSRGYCSSDISSPNESVWASRMSSCSMAELSESGSCVSLRYCLILARYSSKLISISSVSSSMESIKASPFCFFSSTSTSFSLFWIQDSFLFQNWLLMTCAEVRANTLVYSFQVLKIEISSFSLLLRRPSLDSPEFSSWTCFSFELYSDWIFWVNSSPSFELQLLLFFTKLTSQAILDRNSCSGFLEQSLILFLKVRQRGIRYLFFWRMISSLLVTRCNSWKSPNSQAIASANSRQQYSELATYSGKMVSSFNLVSTFQELNQQWLLSCSMIFMIRLRFILRTSSSWRYLLTAEVNRWSSRVHRDWFSERRQESVKICLRKEHSFQKCCFFIAW